AGPGSTADLVILRDNSEKHLSIKLDELAGDKAARRGESDSDDDKAALGVSVAPLTPEVRSRLGASKHAKGVLVEEVNPDGRAASAGIQAGDIIEEVNPQSETPVDELRARGR